MAACTLRWHLASATRTADGAYGRRSDSAAAHALLAAHKRLLADGGELRLVVPGDGAVHRTLTLLGVDEFIHCFASLEEAVASASDGAHWPLDPSGSNPDQHQIKP